MADHPLYAHQLEAARKARELADLEVTGGHIVRAGYRRRPRDKDQVTPRMACRLTGIDWWAPSPLIDFERNTTNFRIPTLLLTPISKTAVPRGPHGETLPDYPDPEASVVGHYGYLERQERAARAARAAGSVLGHGDYIERDGARDVSELGDVSHICTNIHRNPEVRKAFARAVYRHERLGTAKHKLLASTDDLDWWSALAGRDGAPVWVKEAERSLRAEARKAQAKGEKGRALEVEVAEVTERDAYDRIVWCQAQPGWNGKRKQMTFRSNLGGRVQYRFVFQLPYWISAEERLEIVRKMARLMGKMGFMYVAAIHRPDAHNDPRNYHVHLDAYDRPCKFLKKLKMWDFEVVEKKRNGSTRHPERQDKIAGFARPAEEGVNHREHWRQVIRNFREKFCAFTNEVLEKSATSSPLRYHPGPFDAIGLNLRATGKLGGAQMAAEANGLRTGGGDQNAVSIWSDVFDAIYRQRREALDRAWERSRRTMAHLDKVEDPVARHELKAEWAKLRREELALIERRFRFDLGQAEIRMMRSRAEAVLREAGRRGVGRSEGKAYRTSSLGPLRDVALKEAETHLALVDVAAQSQEAVAEELRAMTDEEQRLASAGKRLGAAVLQCQRVPALSLGIERLTPTKVRIPLDGLRPRSEPTGKFAKLETERLLAWFKRHGGELDRFALEGTVLTITAPQAVCTRLAKHCAQPVVVEQLGLIAQRIAEARKAAERSEAHDRGDRKRPGEDIVRSISRGPQVSNRGAVSVARTAGRAEGPALALSEHQPGPVASAPAAEIPASISSAASVERDPVPDFVRVDQEFAQEEQAAGRAVDSELLAFFRQWMAGERTPFYASPDVGRMNDALLVRDYAPGIELVTRKLEAAVGDDQVGRYIRRMIPTLPPASDSEHPLVALPLAAKVDDHLDLLRTQALQKARSGRSAG